MAFPGMGGAGGQAGMDPAKAQEMQMIKTMQMAMESCPVKLGLAGTMGFGLGGLFGLFMSSMRYDTPMSAGLPGGVGAPGVDIASLPMREQLRRGFKDMGKASWSSAKNFGYIGAIYAGSECVIEGFRAKNDIYNPIAGGCVTGAWLAKSGGPQASVLGCAGFAAFSAAIEAYMHMDSNDRATDPVI